MGLQVQDGLQYLHPILKDSCEKIQKEVIKKYNMPFRLFETGRTQERHNHLLSKGRTQDVFSHHLHNLEVFPSLYSIAVDYVYYDGKWSWNLRDKTVMAWYELFGNLVLNACPELTWAASNRKRSNLNHFTLRQEVIEAEFDKFPCILHP
jgi:hypothetical protein